jgi:hypothetical protein
MSKAGPLADTSAISTTQHQVLGAAHTDDSMSNPSISKSLVSDNQLLTAELITLNREVTRLKSDLRIKEDQHKKSEKERLESQEDHRRQGGRCREAPQGEGRALGCGQH